MLRIRTRESAAGAPATVKELFGPDEFLLRRPLLVAINNDDPQPSVLVLSINEIDRVHRPGG